MVNIAVYEEICKLVISKFTKLVLEYCWRCLIFAFMLTGYEFKRRNTFNSLLF